MTTVLVTGASSGFGTAIVRRFAAEGARVIAAARRLSRLEEIAKETGAEPLMLDVRDDSAVEEAFRGLGEIDVLVNNAGLALGFEPAQRASVAEWEQMIDTNCSGLVYCTRAAPCPAARRGCGHVINLGSIAADYPYPGGNVYGATKAFVRQFSLNLRSDVHGTGVRVTCVEPGMAQTEFSLVRFGGDSAKASEVYEGMQPLTPQDVAEAVYWAAAQPPHVNINVIELMPTQQSFAPFQVARDATR
jgi:3-hydroxy acid dehydrogenase/malonic semialdehyde reductase